MTLLLLAAEPLHVVFLAHVPEVSFDLWTWSGSRAGVDIAATAVDGGDVGGESDAAAVAVVAAVAAEVAVAEVAEVVEVVGHAL